MTRTLAVTGANGFVGPHLARAAHDEGWRVWGVGREPEPHPADLFDEYFRADLTRDWPVPPEADAVVHLAGLAAVGASFAEPQRYIETNSRITTTLCETVLRGPSRPRIVVVSSGSVYASTDPSPIDESAPTAATSPYAVSKILVETQAAYYRRRGLDTVVARPFNHIGPGQGPGFLVPDLTRQLRDLPPGAPMHVGNLDAARDFTDVRDVARAYLALAGTPEVRAPTYNVASGVARTGREMLEAIATDLGMTLPTLVVDDRRLRPDDPPRIVGDSSLLRADLGWRAEIDWRTSIRDYLQGAS